MEPQVKRTRYRTAELVVNVSAVMPGQIEDWPANIQDGIYEALMRHSIRTKKSDWTIVHSYSDKDLDEGPYVHVIAVTLDTLQ